MTDRPASWRMPSPKQMVKMAAAAAAVGRNVPQVGAVRPGDEMPGAYWQAVLDDVSADPRSAHHRRRVAERSERTRGRGRRTRHQPELKVLFITGFAQNAAVGNGHLDAGMAVITKRFSNAAPVNKVREIIDTTSV